MLTRNESQKLDKHASDTVRLMGCIVGGIILMILVITLIVSKMTGGVI